MPGKVFRTSAAAIAAQTHDRKQLLEKVILPAEWESAQRTMRLVVADSPVDQGEYKAAWEIRRTAGGHPHLANDAPHAGIIELGARPHWPPFAPILEWAQRKAGDLGLADDEVYGFARAVQRKIAREGSKPHYIMRNRLDDANRFLAEALNRRLAQFAANAGSASKP